MRYIYFVAATVLFMGGCKKKESKGEMPEPTVEVATPVVDSVTLHKTYPGFIRANNSVDVMAKVSGQLLTWNYKAGDYVHEGQVLATIESSKYRDAVQQAEAALKTAQSQYEYASKQYDAMKRALKSDAVSEMEVIQAESSMNQAKAAIQNARAVLSTARENLSYCTIRATRSGHATMGNASTGSYINGAASPFVLATIYDDAEVKAVFEIEDAQYEAMMAGNRGTEDRLLRAIPLSFQQPLPHEYTADLFYVSPNVATGTGTIQLQGILKNKYNELKDGMFVSVALPYGTEPRAILVRDASIGTDQLGKYVYVVNDSNKVVYTPIQVGALYRDSLRIVNSGLKPTDRYVTKALLTVRNGEKVNPVLKGK